MVFIKGMWMFIQVIQVSTYSKRILGDATGEMGPFYDYNNFNLSNWYPSYSFFVDTAPWFYRGGLYNATTHAGQFHFSRGTGEVSDKIGARLVLLG